MDKHIISRRNFLKFSGLSSFLAFGGVASHAQLDTANIELSETDIVLNQLPSSFNNYRIAVLSDLHLSVFVPEEWIEDAIQKINAADVDLILLAGDYLWIPDTTISKSFRNFRNPALLKYKGDDLAVHILSRVADLFTNAKSNDGIYAILGNHDRWTTALAQFSNLTRKNINLLLNQSTKISRDQAYILLLGLDDYWTGVPKITIPKAKSSAAEIRILLAHNPDYLSKIIQYQRLDFDLGVAGHTHGGQICLPLLGTPFYNVQDLRFKAGLFRTTQWQVFTTRGIGVVEVPYRINCRPEVSILTLKS